MDYRAYIMGPDGHIENRVELQCDDDDEAVRFAKQFVDGHDVELWQCDRMVAHLKLFQNQTSKKCGAIAALPLSY